MSINYFFRLKPKLLLFMVVLACFFIGQTAYAEGDSSGGGKSEPLGLVSSSIQNGATGVAIKPEIKLTFTKNIVNMSVVENNRKCFSLQAANGAAIPINLILADDQIDFEKRNDAIIIPKNNLAPGTAYTVVVSSTLTSKSGVTTGKEIRISFTTEGTAPVNNDDSSNTAPKQETAAPKGESAPAPAATAPQGQTTGKSGSVSANSETAASTNKTNETPEETTEGTSNAAEENPAADQQNEKSDEMETVVSDETAVKAVPYQAAAPSKNGNDELQSGNSNTLEILSVFTLIVIAAAAIGIFYLRKKKVKSFSK